MMKEETMAGPDAIGAVSVASFFRNVADNGAAGREWLEFCKG